MITVVLTQVLSVDDKAENSTIQPVHTFTPAAPVRAGTTFQWDGRKFVHYFDDKRSDEVVIYYVEEQDVVEVQ